MIVLPAIDLLHKQVVRLEQGKEESAKVYSDDPLSFAREFQEAGAKWIHVVDLDGAFGRMHENDDVIQNIADNLNIKIELGGGIRDIDRIRHWLDLGVGRVILGSVAVNNPEIVKDAVEQFGADKIVVGIDAKDGMVAVHGWQDVTKVSAVELAEQMKAMGCIRFIVTDIATDGMLTGPKLDTMLEIAERTDLKVIVSGGIHALEDLELIKIHEHKGLDGVITGKAIYENCLDIRQAITQYQTR